MLFRSQLVEKNGAGGTQTDKTSGTVRHKNADNSTVDLVATMVKPPSGSDWSYEKWLRMNVTGGTYTQITGVKVYTDGSSGWTGVNLWWKAVASYATPAEGTASTGYANAFTYTSGAPLSLGAGPYTSTGEKADHLVALMEVTSSATGGFISAAPASAVQDIIKVASGKVNLSIDWPAPAATSFAVAGYELRATNTGWGTAGFKYRGAASICQLTSLSSTTSTTLYLKSFDVLGNYSAAALAIVHDVTAPVSMATATLMLARARATLTMTLSALPAKPTDFDSYEFRIGQVRAGATGGDDTPDAVVSGTTDNFWSDPDCQVVRSATPSASIALSKFTAPLFSTAGVTYRVAARMRDKSDNYSTASAISSITITKIA